MNAGRRRSWRTASCLAWIACLGVLASARIQPSQVDESRRVTLRVLDQAIRSVGQPQADYRKALGDASAALASMPDGPARGGLDAFLKRIPTHGPDYQCSDEFIRARARAMLWRLRDLVLDVQVRPLEPVVCYAVPFAVDLDRAQASGQVVDIYGYDFDATTLQLVVITPDGFTDVTPSLTVKSHTHAAVRIGGGGVPADFRNESIGVAWGHIIHYRVPLVGPSTRLCASRIEAVQPGATVSYDSITRASGPSAPAPADVSADVHLEYSSNVLQAALCVTSPDVMESGCIDEYLHTSDPDRVIDGVLGPQSSRISFARGRTANIDVGGGLVRQWNPGGRQGLEQGSEVAHVVTARLNGIKIVSRDAERCLPPIAYVEAKRTTSFPSATARVLDAQLKALDSAIVRLRPAFAPP